MVPKGITKPEKGKKEKVAEEKYVPNFVSKVDLTITPNTKAVLGVQLLDSDGKRLKVGPRDFPKTTAGRVAAIDCKILKLAEMRTRTIERGSGTDRKIARFKKLQEKIAAQRAELEAAGIDLATL